MKMESTRYLTWKASLDLKTCLSCRDMSGKIYQIGEVIDPEPPLHLNCRCKILPLQALSAGMATKNGFLGADWWLKTYGKLPDTRGWRGIDRILFSNDGLIFVTYDHYGTFNEII